LQEEETLITREVERWRLRAPKIEMKKEKSNK
jgi:hypothetical protein